MQLVEPPRKRLHDYEGLLPPRMLRELQELAQGLRGKRILQVNSTATGGGVAEILHSLVPLAKDLGLQAEWRVFDAPPEFFRITKDLHNALQGAPSAPSLDDWRLYDEVNQSLRQQIDPTRFDHIIVHDPQPAPLCRLGRDGDRHTTWTWRCHIDLSDPNPAALSRLLPWVRAYDASIYTLPDYAPPGLDHEKATIHPGIDPLHPKNRPMPKPEALERVARFGIEPERPLITQVSRFDPWKDPIGVIRAWQKARDRIPGLQLALVGQSADDDPESREVVAATRKEAQGQRGIHLVVDEASDEDVNAFQVASLAILQKSLREGFGLTVSEALWAGTPVIGGDVGGIPLQVRHGENGFLVGTVEECADRIVELAQDPKRAAGMGRRGRERVRESFLLPRVLRDELRLLARLEAKNVRQGF